MRWRGPRRSSRRRRRARFALRVRPCFRGWGAGRGRWGGGWGGGGEGGGGEAGDGVGVVGGWAGQVRVGEGAAAVGAAVEDRRVRLERDPLPQAVQEDGGYQAALLGAAGLLL